MIWRQADAALFEIAARQKRKNRDEFGRLECALQLGNYRIDMRPVVPFSGSPERQRAPRSGRGPSAAEPDRAAERPVTGWITAF
jgi:hypothetical protein